MVPRWQICDLAEDVFDKLLDEGLTLSPQEVLDIQRLSLEASGVTTEERIRMSRGEPVLVGGVYLWPLTFAALEWEEAVEPLLRRESMRTLAMAAAMAYGHDRAKMATRGEDAVRIVREFRKGLAATHPEVTEAIRLVTGEIPFGEPDEERSGNIVLTAASLTGIDPDKLEHDMSIRYLSALVAEAFENNMSSEGGAAPNPQVLAAKELDKYVNELRRRHAEAKAG